jgi:hypothetical protein
MSGLTVLPGFAARSARFVWSAGFESRSGHSSHTTHDRSGSFSAFPTTDGVRKPIPLPAIHDGVSPSGSTTIFIGSRQAATGARPDSRERRT